EFPFVSSTWVSRSPGRVSSFSSALFKCASQGGRLSSSFPLLLRLTGREALFFVLFSGFGFGFFARQRRRFRFSCFCLGLCFVGEEVPFLSSFSGRSRKEVRFLCLSSGRSSVRRRSRGDWDHGSSLF
ncbi:hypothetical protein V8G54_010981, partial [Vigna mungo]